jgi:outer membrane protein TolC
MALAALILAPAGMNAQRLLTLDECRQLAMKNNKQLVVNRDKTEAADWEHKAAKTAYLPKLSATGTYVHNQKSTHLLSKDQRSSLSNMGTSAAEQLTPLVQGLAQQAPQLAQLLGQALQPATENLNSVGSGIVDAFRTSTYNIYAGALTITQPIYLGGRIKAYDKMTGYTRELLGAEYDGMLQEVIYNTDQAYWQIVSLSAKKKLAESYLEVLRKLNSDINKMYKEGVTTKANTLTVNVKLNEAEMTLLKVNDGLSLSRMLLCQLCGLGVNDSIRLADEGRDELSVGLKVAAVDTTEAFSRRHDLKMLEKARLIAEENVKLTRGAFLPSIGAFGGYNISNPNVYNGFKNRFAGNFNIGVALHIPIWNWGEGRYQVRAAKALARTQQHLYDDAKEKINLQLNQAKYKVDEAQKKLIMAQKNKEKADENLRYAQVGFKEGVIPTSDLLEAQTAWVQARSEKIDAEIEVKLTETYLKKTMGETIE